MNQSRLIVSFNLIARVTSYSPRSCRIFISFTHCTINDTRQLTLCCYRVQNTEHPFCGVRVVLKKICTNYLEVFSNLKRWKYSVLEYSQIYWYILNVSDAYRLNLIIDRLGSISFDGIIISLKRFGVVKAVVSTMHKWGLKDSIWIQINKVASEHTVEECPVHSHSPVPKGIFVLQNATFNVFQWLTNLTNS